MAEPERPIFKLATGGHLEMKRVLLNPGQNKPMSPSDSPLSHVAPSGEVHMVDVSNKEITVREAVARGRVRLLPAHVEALSNLPKGDALVTAQIAGIQGGKRTSELIPLCHPIALSKLDVSIHLQGEFLEILATAKTSAPTGVEMEAYTAVAVAGLTLIDMLKGVDADLTLTDIQLLRKSGGRSLWERAT